MRSLLVFGLLALFISLAFTSPSKQNLLARAEQFQVQDAVWSVADGVKGLDAKGRALQKKLTSAHSSAVKVVRVTSQVPLLKDIIGGTVSDSSIKLLKSVEWSMATTDVRECETVANEQGVDDSQYAPSKTDVLAYCIARIQKDPLRCSQISPATNPPLRTLCERELTI